MADPTPAPVSVSERLPEPNTKVLAYYFNDLGNGRTICAIWVPAKSRSVDFDFADDDFTEYDEEDDKYYWPEGWYEAIENWDDLGYVKVDEGEVIYWQPLPQWPAHALPLPSGRRAMAELSPAALHVWDAFSNIVEGHGPPRLGIAAALQALADEVVPEMEEPDWGACNEMRCDIELYTDHQRKRSAILAIAAELRGGADG